MRNKVIGTVTAGVMAVSAAVLGVSSPAMAASRSDACPSWACGSATLTFTGPRTIRSISESIKDTACNGSVAYVRLRVHYSNGTSTYTQKRSASTVCGAGYKAYNGLSFTAGKDIRGVEVFVGDTPNGSKGGNYLDNPYV